WWPRQRERVGRFARPPRAEAPARGDRTGPAQGGRAGRARALEGAAPRRGGAPRARRRAGRRDARPLVDVDARAGEPAARARRLVASSGGARPRREHLVELVGRRHVALVVAAIARRLVGPPSEEGRRVAEPIALQVVVLHLAHALDAERLPREVLAGAPATVSAGHPLMLAAVRLRPVAPG